jgi:hypothetical protein
MLALRVLNKVFDNNNGVSPGTTAIFNPNPIDLRGITNA